MAKKWARLDRPIIFANEWVKDFNGTKAYYRAGYSAKSDKAASAAASRLLVSVKVQEELAKIKDRVSKHTETTIEEIIDELRRIAFSDVRQLYNDDGTFRAAKDIDDNTAAAIMSIDTIETATEAGQVITTKRIRMHPKLPALQELLAWVGEKLSGSQAENPINARPANTPIPVVAVLGFIADLRRTQHSGEDGGGILLDRVGKPVDSK